MAWRRDRTAGTCGTVLWDSKFVLRRLLLLLLPVFTVLVTEVE